MTRLVWLALWAALATGCPHRAGKGVDRPPEANRVRSGHAPTPFSATRIRQGCPDGHLRRYRVEVPGKPAFFRTLRFEGGTKKSTIFISEQEDAKGRPVGEQRRVRALWKGLQMHASFPERDTRIKALTHTTPAGSFPSWRYEVRRRVGGKRHVLRFWFAKSLPGPPVEFDHRVDGRRVFRMVLLVVGRVVKPPTPGRRPPRRTGSTGRAR